MIKVNIINGLSQKFVIEAQKNETIRELKQKYLKARGLSINSVYFICNGNYLEDDFKLYDCYYEGDYINSSDFAGYHKCPYGCGRSIPDEYKGCTEFLKDFPNYYN